MLHIFRQVEEIVNAPLTTGETEEFKNAALYFLDDTQRSPESQVAATGTATQLYIERGPSHYPQLEVISFYQTDIQQKLSEVLIYLEIFRSFTVPPINDLLSLVLIYSLPRRYISLFITIININCIYCTTSKLKE